MRMTLRLIKMLWYQESFTFSENVYIINCLTYKSTPKSEVTGDAVKLSLGLYGSGVELFDGPLADYLVLDVGVVLDC